MSYKLNILHDNPLAFWSLDEVSGSVAKDSSPYGNDAEYFGDISISELPIVVNSDNAKVINNTNYVQYYSSKDYVGNESKTSFGTKETSDNSFTLECWIKPNIEMAVSDTCLLGDLTNDIGIFWSYGKIIFKVQSEEISYLVPNYNRAMHIVCVYLNSEIYLYLDAKIVAYKKFNNFRFSNSTNVIKSGPTLNDQDSFLIDSPAIYRYGLNSNQISNHYFSAKTIPAIQVAHPEDGELFKIQDTGVSRQFEYTYPGNRSWRSFNNNKLFYDDYDNSLSLVKGSLEADSTSIESLVSVPVGFDLNSSKIEWVATKGVEVYASVDNVTFIKCQNGFPVPKYKYGPNNFDLNRKVYLSIRFESSNTAKYLPKIYSVVIGFYNNKKVYSFNGGSTLSHLGDNLKKSDISFGNNYSDILLRDYKNGLICSNGSGFNFNTARQVQTIEFFYTPHILNIIDASVTDITQSLSSIIDSLITTNPSGQSMTASTITDLVEAKSTLIYKEDESVQYSWAVDGTVTMSGIDKIFINGQNKTSETNILDLFKLGALYHIVIVLDDPTTGDIQFNYSDVGSVQATYQNLIAYPSQFSSTKCLSHFNMWIGKNTIVANDSSMTLTENSISTFDNEWQVLQTA